MENPKQNNSFTDHEHIAELKAKVDQMDESNFDEKVFREYLNALGDDAKPKEPIDVEASLTRFRSKQALLIDRLDEKAKLRSAQTKSYRRRRWGYRLVVVIAAIIILNVMCIVAFGHSMFNYVAKWGEETFGFFRESDFETSEDGNIIYYPDGTEQNRSDMPDYNHTTYEQFPQSGSDSIVSVDSSDDLLELPSQSPLAEFAGIPDTDTSVLGLKIESSEWNSDHTIEYIHVVNSTISETAKAFGEKKRLFLTWLPDGFVQSEVTVTKDYMTNTVDFSAIYAKRSSEYVFCVEVKDLVEESGSLIIEKDDRAVEVYASNGMDWYIMSNLENVNATTIVGDRQVLFSGPISIDEMKKVIDSVYEGD